MAATMVLDTEPKAPNDASERLVHEAFRGFLDIPMTLRAEIGRRKYRCADLLTLHVGTIVSLPRSAGDNVTLRLNGQRIGAGEIVVIEDQMGLRITEIAGHRPGEKS